MNNFNLLNCKTNKICWGLLLKLGRAHKRSSLVRTPTNGHIRIDRPSRTLYTSALYGHVRSLEDRLDTRSGPMVRESQEHPCYQHDVMMMMMMMMMMILKK